MVKKPSQQAFLLNSQKATSEQAEQLAQRLADKPYGSTPENPVKPPAPQSETLTRVTISIPKTSAERLEDLALRNKRYGDGAKTVSALVREAVDMYMNEQEKQSIS